MSGGNGPLVPTFHGFVQNSMDGLVLFEACLSGKLHHVPRRPHDRERAQLIKSGSIFIYEENASGIKRWTDGVAWSPSRILGNFLIYRELEKPFPPGEKKRAMKRKRSSQLSEGFRRGSEENESSEVLMPPTPPSPKPAPPPSQAPESGGDPNMSSDTAREMERQLIGSLVDSYGFRPDGLVKKTMSIAINGISHHLVSYYKVDDVKNKVLNRPLSDPRLANITVRQELYMKQNFRQPVEETEHYVVDPQSMRALPGLSYGSMVPGAYGMRSGQYMAAPPGYPMYGASSGGMYAPQSATAWGQPHQPMAAPSYPPQPYGYGHGEYDNRNAASTPQSASMKQDDPGSASSAYGHYPGQYNSVGRSGSVSSYQAPYQSPMRPLSQPYGGASSQPPQSSGTPAPTSSNGPSSQMYNGTPTQPHGFDNKMPPQQYAPQSHYGQPGNGQMKSPAVGGGQIPPIASINTQPQMPYRHGAYGAQDGTPSSEVGNMAMGSSYGASAQPASATYSGGSYSGYNTPSSHTFRSAPDSHGAQTSSGSY